MKFNEAKKILEFVGYIVESFEDELRNAFITQCGEMVINNEPIWRKYYNRIMKNPEMAQYVKDAQADGMSADEIVEYLLDLDEHLNEARKPKINEFAQGGEDIPLEDKLPATGTLDWLVPVLEKENQVLNVNQHLPYLKRQMNIWINSLIHRILK